MQCRACGNQSDFNAWLDVGIRVRWDQGTGQGEPLSVREVHRALCETMPVFCGRCGSDEVEATEDDWRRVWEELTADAD